MQYLNKVNLGKTLWWSPWFGCDKISSACQNCFIKIRDFKLADIYGTEQIDTAPEGTIIITSVLTDFFWEAADEYRNLAWKFIREHPHLIFLIITKRLEHGRLVLPEDWGSGWDNVIINVTVDNNDVAEDRISQLRDFPAKHKWLSCAPLVSPMNISSYLAEGWIEHVESSGEIGDVNCIRETRIEWVRDLLAQCKQNNVRFSFMKCGKKFIIDNSQTLVDYASCYHSEMSDDFELSYYVPLVFNLTTGSKIII
jgi:protein gp37